MEFGGDIQISKLCLVEVEDHNYEDGLTWYREIKKVLTSGSLPEGTIEYCLAKARILLDDVAGVELAGDEDEAEPEAEEPRAFRAGGKAVCGSSQEGWLR